jgi:ATP-dependent DNA helicase RecG
LTKKGITMEFKETEILELKKTTSELKEAIIAIVAILNKHQSGELYFGISNDGRVLGQDISEKTIRDISKSVSDHIEPKIYPEIKKVVLENKKCIYVNFNGNDIPYYAYGRPYIRVGDENKQLSAKQIENIIINKNIEKLRWDNQPSDKMLSMINNNLVKKYVSNANNAGRINFSFENVKATLSKLGLLKKGKLLKAAEVLFCDENPLELQTAIFAGVEKLTFLDIQSLQGNIFNLLSDAEIYIKKHIRWRVEFGKLEREEIPEIPIDAVREALVNSWCHRDFSVPENNKVALFKNRLEIYNPGQFPEGLKPEDFIKGHEESVLRNPLIAKVLYKSKDIEKWGSGLKKIYNLENRIYGSFLQGVIDRY